MGRQRAWVRCGSPVDQQPGEALLARLGSAPDEQVGEREHIHGRPRASLAGGHEGVARGDGGQQQECGRQAVHKDAQRQPECQAGHVAGCGRLARHRAQGGAQQRAPHGGSQEAVGAYGDAGSRSCRGEGLHGDALRARPRHVRSLAMCHRPQRAVRQAARMTWQSTLNAPREPRLRPQQPWPCPPSRRRLHSPPPGGSTPCGGQLLVLGRWCAGATSQVRVRPGPSSSLAGAASTQCLPLCRRTMAPAWCATAVPTPLCECSVNPASAYAWTPNLACAPPAARTPDSDTREGAQNRCGGCGPTRTGGAVLAKLLWKQPLAPAHLHAQR